MRHHRAAASRCSPELRDGIWATLALAVLATAGRVVVPIAVQQTLDRGLGRRTAARTSGFMARWPSVAARRRSWSPASRRT